MVGYDVGVAAGGIALAVGLANCWNPAGWVALSVQLIYGLVTFGIGFAIENGLGQN